ncbi:MAG: 5-formyltetrahydrofolate cyclo-ligase [Pseudomonadota bacterium]|nr:5-formyltetrahydrofolate cyclo-ligase [Pseudomonadota bacterium]
MIEASTKSDKAAARLAAVERRKLLAAAAPGAGERIADHFMEAYKPGPGFAVAGFWPMWGEIDLRPLLRTLEEAGCLCLLPVATTRATSLVFRRWQPGQKLIQSAFGVMEPGLDATEVRPKIVIVPLLAFDGDGYRLGYGGGYYDRTLAALRGDGTGAVTAVGAAFARQRLDRCPRGPFDQRLDGIVTEYGAHSFD